MESLLLFTLCYILFCICFVFPPPEFVSVGLTVESLFSFWLKSEADCFIHHHIRRTVATLIVHSCIPLGYVLGLRYISPDSSIWEKNMFLEFFVVTSFTIPIIAFLTALQWYQTNWRNHPIAKNLKHFTSGGNDINRIARDIDSEYKSIDKIIIKCNSLTRVVATDNWIIRIRPYSLNIAHQSDASLVVSSSDSHLYVPDRPEGSQYLNIDVKSSRPNVNSFQIRQEMSEGISLRWFKMSPVKFESILLKIICLQKPFIRRINSADFMDLQEKMIRPISIMENVDFHGNLTDCFLNVFKQHIKQNPKVLAPENLDVCIGCLLATPNVKLMTSCGDTTGPEKCSMCYCKPLWCEDCMGKWFASRQDQEKPDTWLSSKATCPMCRSTFCLLDVCLLVPSKSDTEEDEQEL